MRPLVNTRSTNFREDKGVAICVHDTFGYSCFLHGGMGDLFLNLYCAPDLIRSIIEVVVA